MVPLGNEETMTRDGLTSIETEVGPAVWPAVSVTVTENMIGWAEPAVGVPVTVPSVFA